MAIKKTAQKKTVQKAVKKTRDKKAGKKAFAKKIVKKAPAKKIPVKKSSAQEKSVSKKRVKKPSIPVPAHKPSSSTPATVPSGKKLAAKEIREFKEILLTLRERISGEYSALSRDNLQANQRDPSLSDQGTDTFDREMELNMMGSEQEIIFEIDAALRRIETGTYGVCELTNDPISKERLQALPYVRYTLRAQSELEKGRAHYRPFGGTLRG